MTAELEDTDRPVIPPGIIHGQVGLAEDRDSRYYVDPSSGRLHESVTSAIAVATGKPWLAPWGAKSAAQFTVGHLDLIRSVAEEASAEGAVALITKEAQRLRELKRDIGSHQHHVIEALIIDAPIPSVPDHLVGVEIDGETVDQDLISDGFLNFCEDHDPEFEMAEATVASAHGWAGTLDIIALMRRMGRRFLIDVKTGAVLDSTIAPQLAAYKYADEVWIDHMGNKAPMPVVDGCAVLHLRPEHPRGYKLQEIPIGDAELSRFMDMYSVAAAHRANPKLVMKTLYRPLDDGSQPPPQIEDVDALGRAKSPLIKAGFRSLSDVAGLTAMQLDAVTGLGPKTVPIVLSVLADHGLVLTRGAA